jgi:hypothetical protein
MRTIRAFLVVTAAMTTSIVAHGQEVQIPSAPGDKGKYFLLDVKRKDGILTTLHKRVGVYETGYSKTQINCRTRQYRDMAYGEEGPNKLKPASGSKWTDLVEGSSKSYLVTFACSR